MKKNLFLFLFVYFSPINAAPVSFDFTHGGFNLDATVTGSFSGEDRTDYCTEISCFMHRCKKSGS
jgi:hypothetical protein